MRTDEEKEVKALVKDQGIFMSLLGLICFG